MIKQKKIHFPIAKLLITKKLINCEKNLFSMTGTSTACNVFGRNREPGFNAPHPAAQPNFPKKSSFFSGKHMGAVNCNLKKNKKLF